MNQESVEKIGEFELGGRAGVRHVGVIFVSHRREDGKTVGLEGQLGVMVVRGGRLDWMG